MTHECDGLMDTLRDFLIANAALHYIEQPKAVSEGLLSAVLFNLESLECGYCRQEVPCCCCFSQKKCLPYTVKAIKENLCE